VAVLDAVTMTALIPGAAMDGLGARQPNRQQSRTTRSLRATWRQVTLLLAAVGLLLAPIPLLAQGETVAMDAPAVTWSEPTNLSRSSRSSAYPTIVADQRGWVHVLWSQDMTGMPMREGDLPTIGNAIAYTRWDGHRWTQPVDVVSVPDEALAGFPEVALDANDNLHLVWIGQSTVYYSRAPAHEAASTHAWSSPVAVAQGNLPRTHPVDVAVDHNAVIHVVLADNSFEGAARSTRSLDGGTSWQPLQDISAHSDPLETGVARVQLVVDALDRLHATWQTNQAEGYGQAVYYARSLDGGQTWDTPQRFGYRDPGEIFVEYLTLTSRGDNELHSFYVDGTGIGRWHRISTDGGETWSAAQHVITDMEGVNGYMAPVVDGAGRLHLIINMRTRAGQAVGVYHATWLDGNWSAVRAVDDSSPAAPSAHAAAATIRLGNEIHVAYVQLAGGEIWHARGTISDIEPQPTIGAATGALAPLPTVAVPTPPSGPIERTAVAQLSLPAGTEAPGGQWAWLVGLMATAALVVGVSWRRLAGAQRR